MTPPAPQHPARIAGIDLARFLAIAGMLAVHVGPSANRGEAEGIGVLYVEMTHGRASILFGLLAGIGVTLLASGRSATPGTTRLRLLWQAALLLPLGLWLQGLDVRILIILAHYAALFALGALCIGLATRALAALALTALALGPVGFQLGRRMAPGVFDRAALDLSVPPLEILHGLVLSGPYPLLTWAGPFLLGMALGRLDLRARRLRLLLVAGGLGLALAAAGLAQLLAGWLGPAEWPGDWRRLADDRPHSQMPFWLIGATGSALAALGLCLAAADRFGRLVWPFVATGQCALTVYVAHVLAFHFVGDALRANAVGGALAILAPGLAGAVAAASLWRALLPRGPLEAVLALPGTVGRWRRAGRGVSPDRASG